MSTILVVLQNAYREGADGSRAEQRWLKSIWRDGGTGWKSHTGKRLKNILPEYYSVEVINASNNVGNVPSACFHADVKHIEQAIMELQPRVIVGCGRIAQAALDELGYDYVQSPHPAWRQLSKECEREVQSNILKRLGGGSSSG